MTLHAVALAKDTGFLLVRPCRPQQLSLKSPPGEKCTPARCDTYGRNWSCPPGCGSLSWLTRRLNGCSGGIAVASEIPLQGNHDLAGMLAGERAHALRFQRLLNRLREEGRSVLPFAQGPCTRCAICTCPDAPCRYPGERVSALEAWGISPEALWASCGPPRPLRSDTLFCASAVFF